MRIRLLFNIMLACVALAWAPVGSRAAVILQSSEPVALSGGLFSTQVSLVSDSLPITALGNISVTGHVHQVGIVDAFGGPPGRTPGVDSHSTPGFNAAWAPYDTYVKIPNANKVGSAGLPLAESNDLATQGTLGLPMLGTFPVPSGFGDLKSEDGSDAFGLVPNAQGLSVNFLQVVGPMGTADVGVSYSLSDGSEGRLNFTVLGGVDPILPTVGDLNLVTTLLGETVSDVVALTDVVTLAFDDINNPTFTPLIPGKTLDLPILPTLGDDGSFSWNTSGAKRGVYSWAITGTNPDGTDGGVISVEVTQVPEPATFALLGLAIVGFAGIRRK